MKFPIFLILFLILTLSATTSAQKTVSDLKPAHAIALERFLSKHPDYGFLSERAIEDDYLNQAAKWFGKRIVPYYQIADLNHDGIQDFAMILSREGEPEDTGSDVEAFRYDHPLVIVIFNGGRRGAYTPAFVKEIKAPLYCFLNTECAKKKEIYFGVFESDAETMIFTPAGKGYLIEYPKNP